jgi:hypothetical protein
MHACVSVAVWTADLYIRCRWKEQDGQRSYLETWAANNKLTQLFESLAQLI